MPLELGNQWVYQTADGSYSFTISVGVSEIHGDRPYHSVRGYGYGHFHNKLLVRQSDEGDLYTIDGDTGQDALLTMFTHVPGGSFDSRLGECEEVGRVAPERHPWASGSTTSAAAVVIKYQSFGCADLGIAEEVYVENLGLVSRKMNTVIGPLEFRLHYARVGNLVYRAGASSTLSLDLDRAQVDRAPGESQSPVRIKLRYAMEPLASGVIRFLNPMAFDLYLVDSNGVEVWRWSDNQAVIQQIIELPHNGFIEFEAFMPVNNIPAGNYMLYGWLNTVSERQPTVGIPFQVVSIQPASISESSPEAQP